MDYYRLLGVARSASQAQIKTAFRALALELHPDMQASKAQAVGGKSIPEQMRQQMRQQREENFTKVAQAYEVLSHKMKRQEYDMQFGGAGRTSQRYSAQGPVSRHAQNNGMSTDYRPGGRHGGTGANRTVADAYIPTEHFNMHAWEASHYGESAAEQGTTVGKRAAAAAAQNGQTGGSAWMNMGNGSHQNYFRKRAAAQARQKAAWGVAGDGDGAGGGAAGAGGYKERPGASGPAQAYAAYAAAAQEQAIDSRTSAAQNLQRKQTERRRKTEMAKPYNPYAHHLQQQQQTGAAAGEAKHEKECTIS